MFHAGSHLFFFSNTKSSNSSSVMFVRLFVIVRPAQLNRRSAAALAGRGVFRRRNRSFNSGQAATVAVSSDAICMYCVSASVGFPGAALPTRRRVKKSSSSASADVVFASAATVTTAFLNSYTHEN